MTYRCYDYDEKVRNTYRLMYTEQTLERVNYFNTQYNHYDKFYGNIFQALHKLDEIVDESDPDNDLPQHIHAYQTAERLRCLLDNIDNITVASLFNEYEWVNLPVLLKEKWRCLTITNLYDEIKDWDWLPLIGLIHDLGKVLILNQWGGLPQHFVVGDTYPLGAPLHPSVVLYDCHYHDSNNDINGSVCQYYNNIGFDNMTFTFSHDNYLANLLKWNSFLPDYAIYIVKFHSFYPFHTPPINKARGYTQYACDKDWYYLPLLKLFQSADLYSKKTDVPTVTKAMTAYYKELTDKYIPGNFWW